MITTLSKKQYYGSISGLLILFIYYFYGDILLSPNTYLFSSIGDSLKNYFSFISYISNNESNLEFDSMNFPYKESILFVDSHPLLAFFLKGLNNLLPFLNIAQYGIGILNSLLLFSFFITAYFLLKIFIELKVNPILAILSAVSITILNPQAIRLAGHFSLAYGFFIPLVIYYLIKIEQDEKRFQRKLYLVLWILVFYFTHAYLGVIASSIIICYSFFRLITRLKTLSNELKQTFLIFITGVLPLIIFYFLANWFDQHTGRTTNPWGIYKFHAKMDTVFLPFLGPFTDLKEFLFGKFTQNREAVSYVGIVNIIGLTVIIISSIIYSVRNKTLSLNKTLLPASVIRLLLVSSVIILLVSMLYPFRWNLEHLLENLNLIKQFRSIGRFAWVFFIVSSISVVYLFNNLIQQLDSKKQVLAVQLFILIPILFFYEGVGYHIENSERVIKSKNVFNKECLSPEFTELIEQIPTENKFQAIIPLPFYHIGSENFEIRGSEKMKTASFILSHHTQIPLVSNMSARNSIWESKNVIQLLSSNFYEKPIKQHFKSTAPLLIIAEKELRSESENRLIKKGTLLHETQNYSLFELDFNTLFKPTNNEEIKNYESLSNFLFKKNGFWVNDTNLFFKFDDLWYPQPIDFNSFENSREITGEYNLLLKIPPNSLRKDRLYRCRFWMYNGGENFGQDVTKSYLFFDMKKGDKSNWLDPIIKPSSSTEINQQWTLVETSLYYGDPNHEYHLILQKLPEYNTNMYIKDLLFYDNRLKIYKEIEANGNKYLFMNNHHVKY